MEQDRVSKLAWISLTSVALSALVSYAIARWQADDLKTRIIMLETKIDMLSGHR